MVPGKFPGAIVNIHPVLLEKVAQDAARRGADDVIEGLLGPFVLVAHLPHDVTTNPRQVTRPVVGGPDPAVLDGTKLDKDMVCWPLKRSWRSGARFSIGRDPGNDVVIPHPGISKLHARITLEDQGISLADAGSVNGTWIHDTVIDDEKPVSIKDGGVFRLGTMEFCLWSSARLIKALLTQ